MPLVADLASTHYRSEKKQQQQQQHLLTATKNVCRPCKQLLTAVESHRPRHPVEGVASHLASHLLEGCLCFCLSISEC